MEENKMEIFTNPEFGSVRTLTIDGEPYFVGKDVAEILGYSNSRDALARHIDEEDKAGVEFHDGSQKRNAVAINESGLYSLILSSKLQTAKKFKRWVTSEVLPAIRKTGSFNADYSALSPQLQYLISLEQKTNALEERQKQLEEKIAETEEKRSELVKAAFEFGRIGDLQRKEIAKAVKKRAIELCRYAETYDKVGKSVISSIYNALQKHFDVKSYIDISYNQYTDCMIFVQYFEPDVKLFNKIYKEAPKISLSLLNAFAGGNDNEKE